MYADWLQAQTFSDRGNYVTFVTPMIKVVLCIACMFSILQYWRLAFGKRRIFFITITRVQKCVKFYICILISQL